MQKRRKEGKYKKNSENETNKMRQRTWLCLFWRHLPTFPNWVTVDFKKKWSQQQTMPPCDCDELTGEPHQGIKKWIAMVHSTTNKCKQWPQLKKEEIIRANFQEPWVQQIALSGTARYRNPNWGIETHPEGGRGEPSHNGNFKGKYLQQLQWRFWPIE